MAENPRIEELRRRVQKDPASIAFAQLAEEYRRAGHYEDAIDICRTGLQTHPSYLSARVTLGRALIETNDLENAEAELRYVLQHAAENLAAIRAMAEIHQRRGELTEALGFYKSALELARHDPDLEQTVDEISRTIAKAPAPASAPAPVAPAEAAPALTPEQRSAEFLATTFDLLDLEDLDLVSAPAVPTPAAAEPAQPEPVVPLTTAALPEPEAQPEPEARPEPEGRPEPEAQLEPELPVYAAPADDLSQLEDFLNQLPGAPEPLPAEPVLAATLPEPAIESEPDLPVHAAPADDFGQLEDFLNQLPVAAPKPMPAEPVVPVMAAAPVDDLAMLDNYLDQQAPVEDLWSVVEVPEPAIVAEPADDLVVADDSLYAPMDMGVIMNPALPGLERFLEAIHTYRQRRAI